MAGRNSESTHDTPTGTYVISVKRMTAESVVYVVTAGLLAVTGITVALTFSALLGLLIMIGALPLWGWACVANKRFYSAH